MKENEGRKGIKEEGLGEGLRYYKGRKKGRKIWRKEERGRKREGGGRERVRGFCKSEDRGGEKGQ